MDRFTYSFLILGGMLVFTYIVSPDVQTTLIALKTGVNKEQIAYLWLISIVGIAFFMYMLYRAHLLP